MVAYLQIVLFLLIAVGVVVFFLRGNTGKQEPVWALWTAAGIGLLGLALAIFLETKAVPQGFIVRSGPLPAIARSAVAIGVIEELSKFIVLAIFIYKQKFFNSYRDGVLYFAIAGSTFGLIENIAYTMQMGTRAGFLRLFMTPVFHAATTGIAGYYLSAAKMRHRSPWVALGPLFGMVAVHAFYDFGLLSNITPLVMMCMFVSAMLAVGLFLYFLHAKTLDMVLVPATERLAHTFCTGCGHGNPGHLAFCQQCGKPSY